MAPKPKGKGGAKQLATLAQLTAFTATYKAAARKHSVTPNKTLLRILEDAVQEGKGPDKITFSSPDITGPALRAVLDCLAGYPNIKNVCLYGCSIGDEGMLALSQLLKSSVDKWYKGSKIRLLEVINDGAGVPLDQWGQRYLDMVSGKTGLLTKGAAFEMPSLLMHEVKAVTPDTLMLQKAVSAPEESDAEAAAAIEEQFRSLMMDVASKTSLSISQSPATLAHASGHGAPALTSAVQDPRFLANSALEPQRPLAFSYGVLKELSLSLSAQGLMLQVVSLDHNYIGDTGMEILALGLKRCGKLKQLSLANCGISRKGAVALAATLVPDPQPLLAALQPKYILINLARNPIGGDGLLALCEGLGKCTTLKIVDFCSCGIIEQDVPALEELAQTLQTNPSIDQVDLDANFIGDRGASVFLPFLEGAKHIRRFRLTTRLSRAVTDKIKAIMEVHRPPKKKGLKKKKKT